MRQWEEDMLQLVLDHRSHSNIDMQNNHSHNSQRQEQDKLKEQQQQVALLAVVAGKQQLGENQEEGG